MKTQLFCAILALSIFAVSEGKAAATVGVECKKYTGHGIILRDITTTMAPIKQLKIACRDQLPTLCKDNQNNPTCAAAVLH